MKNIAYLIILSILLAGCLSKNNSDNLTNMTPYYNDLDNKTKQQFSDPYHIKVITLKQGVNISLFIDELIKNSDVGIRILDVSKRSVTVNISDRGLSYLSNNTEVLLIYSPIKVSTSDDD